MNNKSLDEGILYPCHLVISAMSAHPGAPHLFATPAHSTHALMTPLLTAPRWCLVNTAVALLLTLDS